MTTAPSLTQTHTTALSADALRAIPCHDAAQLTEGGAVANIHLNGQFYALRITRAGKLILTK